MSMRMSPPTRTSHSQRGLVNPRGPHQRATCSGSVHALKTRLRGAPKMRVKRSSCGACPVAELFVVSAMFLLLVLGLHFGEVIVKSVEPLLPGHTVVLHPVGYVLERSSRDAAGPPLSRTRARDQSRALKYL